MVLDISKRDLAALAAVSNGAPASETDTYSVISMQRAANGPVRLVASNGRAACGVPVAGELPVLTGIPVHLALAGSRLKADNASVRIALEDNNVHIHGDGESIWDAKAMGDIPEFSDLEKKAGGAKASRTYLTIDVDNLLRIAKAICPQAPRYVRLAFDPSESARTMILMTDATRNALDDAFERSGVLSRVTAGDLAAVGESRDRAEDDPDFEVKE